MMQIFQNRGSYRWYADYIHIQEYAPPKTVDPVKATERLEENHHGGSLCDSNCSQSYYC